MIDHIFIHELDDKPYIFIVLTPVDILDEKDDVLDLHKVIYRPSEPVIVGINDILPVKLYVVQIDDDNTVFVDWQVEWL
jgi:hypothetical protein